jgi:hypothetical protein
VHTGDVRVVILSQGSGLKEVDTVSYPLRQEGLVWKQSSESPSGPLQYTYYTVAQQKPGGQEPPPMATLLVAGPEPGLVGAFWVVVVSGRLWWFLSWL